MDAQFISVSIINDTYIGNYFIADSLDISNHSMGNLHCGSLAQINIVMLGGKDKQGLKKKGGTCGLNFHETSWQRLVEILSCFVLDYTCRGFGVNAL